jgi:hypothetical protein
LLLLYVDVGKVPAAAPKTPFAPGAACNAPDVTGEAKTPPVTPKNAFALTENTYVTPGWSCTGLVSVCCCQPDAVSFAKATWAICVPSAVQTRPMCDPVSSGSL